MNTERLEPGALVRHRARPGIWRIVGVIGWRAEIEPWDDLAGGSLHPAEAYSIQAPVQLLSRALPGRSAPPLPGLSSLPAMAAVTA
jgi:hypothetical protein